MAQKPSIPKGTRDFSPTEVNKRNYIFDIVKKHFRTFGFQPIETPSFENSETLMGKYGDEGDRLIFKILNSGEFLKNIDKSFIRLLNKKEKEVNDFIKELQEIYVLKNTNIEGVFDENGFTTKSKIFRIFKESNFNIESDYFISGKNQILKEAQDVILKNASKGLGQDISEKALRYDLTVPFARYVVMHQNEIDFPFKRYQIQPVWRADRPQKGRFREFFQCDADVVGANSLLQEVEFVQLYDAVFTDLGLQGTTIKMNNRKILSGIAEVIGAKHLLVDFTVALDKLDKIGEEGVKKEMLAKGISEKAIEKVTPLFSLSGTNIEQLAQLQELLQYSEEGSKGVEELRFIINSIEALGLQSANLSLDVTLARGLNYYTGAIFEVSAPEGVKMGSIGGGGRYDDLTGVFGLKDVSGVGISFGLDRIYLVLEELNLFPEAIDQSLDVLFLNLGKEEAFEALKLVTKFRRSGVKADLYPESAKNQKQENKQFKFAKSKNVSFIVSISEKELAGNSFVVKKMANGSQETYSLDKAEDFISQL